MKFGDRIIINGRAIREYFENGSILECKWEFNPFESPQEGVFLRFQSLSNGTYPVIKKDPWSLFNNSKDHNGEYPDPPEYEVEERIKYAYVCLPKQNAFYVPITEIQLL